jgi:hypothetical protein
MKNNHFIEEKVLAVRRKCSTNNCFIRKHMKSKADVFALSRCIITITRRMMNGDREECSM